MKTVLSLFLSCVSCVPWFLSLVPWFLSALAADPLTESFQKGLLEEDVNRDLKAAAQAYESAVKQADVQRTPATFGCSSRRSHRNRTRQRTAW